MREGNCTEKGAVSRGAGIGEARWKNVLGPWPSRPPLFGLTSTIRHALVGIEGSRTSTACDIGSWSPRWPTTAGATGQAAPKRTKIMQQRCPETLARVLLLCFWLRDPACACASPLTNYLDLMTYLLRTVCIPFSAPFGVQHANVLCQSPPGNVSPLKNSTTTPFDFGRNPGEGKIKRSICCRPFLLTLVVQVS